MSVNYFNNCGLGSFADDIFKYIFLHAKLLKRCESDKIINKW